MLFTERNADNLLVGAGRLYLARVAAGVKDKWRHAGNAPTIELTTADTKIQKYSSMDRNRDLYAERLQRRLVTVKCVLDEFTIDNVADALQGKIVIDTQANTPVVDEILEADVPVGTLGALRGGAWYPLAKVGPVIVTEVSLGAVTLVEGTDYEVDAEGGLIGILSTSTAVTNATDDLLCSYTPNEYTSLYRIRGGSEKLIEVAGIYSPDPCAGPRHKLEWWRGAITPDGAFGLISEEFTNMTINISLQNDSRGLYGGSKLYPTHRITQLASEAEDIIT